MTFKVNDWAVEAYDKLMKDVSLLVGGGAPMGFRNRLKGKTTNLCDMKVIIEDGYDRAGRYWGNPNNMRVRFNKDLSYVEFYRYEDT